MKEDDEHIWEQHLAAAHHRLRWIEHRLTEGGVGPGARQHMRSEIAMLRAAVVLFRERARAEGAS